ncbi:MAG TPA: peptidoglycan-binding protein [Gaiellaceae bacterium]|jgi:predicted chitinase
MPPLFSLKKPQMKGPGVKAVQQQLKAQGYLTGAADGIYGPATAQAVKAFQQANGLPVDGVVGPQTRTALAQGSGKPKPTPAAATGGATIAAEAIASCLGCPVGNVQTHWPALQQALAECGLTDQASAIAALATIGTEVPSFLPINEYGGDAYFTKMYEGRKDLGNVKPGDGARYHGRGFIQLTGRANYRSYGQKLGVPLEAKPELALDAAVAARILATYMRDRGLGPLAARGDWQGVRRGVNGGLNGWDRFSSLVTKLQQAGWA